jgi:hypothetical protein
MADWLGTLTIAADSIRIEAGFASDPTLLLVSLPVALLGYLPKDPAIIMLGISRSANLLTHPLPDPSTPRLLSMAEPPVSAQENAPSLLFPEFIQPTLPQPHAVPILPSLQPSSGAWNPQDDQTVMLARAQGLNWAPIQQSYFPNKASNACRKRHERLMERHNADDWDRLKVENLAKHYMGMRREIWSGLASVTGEKWNVVEAKV